ncbi:MAG TPA: hypothetical protein RMG48_14615, partial [Myxococcales bacterium LLY-WYZ-16_1]|nr:hypothetical protein [Myxococcales bacterium LLY-WYZ-16_1]
EEVGFHADGTDSWLAALRQLRDSPGLRAQLGANGRGRCERLYSLDSQAHRLLQIYADAVRQV